MSKLMRFFLSTMLLLLSISLLQAQQPDLRSTDLCPHGPDRVTCLQRACERAETNPTREGIRACFNWCNETPSNETMVDIMACHGHVRRMVEDQGVQEDWMDWLSRSSTASEAVATCTIMSDGAMNCTPVISPQPTDADALLSDVFILPSDEPTSRSSVGGTCPDIGQGFQWVLQWWRDGEMEGTSCVSWTNETACVGDGAGFTCSVYIPYPKQQR